MISSSVVLTSLRAVTFHGKCFQNLLGNPGRISKLLDKVNRQLNGHVHGYDFLSRILYIPLAWRAIDAWPLANWPAKRLPLMELVESAILAEVVLCR